MNRRRRIVSGEDGGLSSRLLGLSLFIMLLAFFIVLNAISNFEESKTRNILDSIEFAFTSQASPRGDFRPSVTKDVETSIYDGDTITRIGALFQAQIPAHTASVDKKRGTMHIRVSRADFETAIAVMDAREAPGNATVEMIKESAFGRYFLPTLVTMLRSADRGQPFRMEITYNIDGNPARAQRLDPQKLESVMRRATDAAATIERAGLPAYQVTAAVEDGDPDMIDLFFLPHEKFDAQRVRAVPSAAGADTETETGVGGGDGTTP